jgi:hypothetical protein
LAFSLSGGIFAAVFMLSKWILLAKFSLVEIILIESIDSIHKVIYLSHPPFAEIKQIHPHYDAFRREQN